jgi:aminopeptidase N
VRDERADDPARPLRNLVVRAARIAACAAAVALGTFGRAAAADAPFSFATAPGHLPKTVVPVAYELTIEPHPATLALGGTERVTLDVQRPTIALEFNALNLRFTSVRIDGLPPRAVAPDDRSQRTTVTLAQPLAPGRHTLDLVYTGRLETAGQGMFRQQFVAPGHRLGTLVTTQFEATDARRMFACWDEPAFRSTFALTVIVPAAWIAVSNMPVRSRSEHNGRATIAFGRTPTMPTYLLEVTAGDLAHVNGVDRRGTRHEVWAVRGQERNGRFALGNSRAILTDYDDYFGIRFPLPRLASIAIPGGFEGAMENWGAITYNDQILLLGANASLEQRQDIYAVQAHEMAHQWFGDLVTMGWWDDLWLNESFASWMAAKQTDRAHPEWHWWQNQDADKESAMNADARIHTHPIQQPVRNDTEAESSFDSEITYAKGQAFLRMLEAYLGPTTFRDGIRTYLQRRAYSNATGADLWDALAQRSGKPVGALTDAWIFRPGFPLVTVTSTCSPGGLRTIDLHQERFLLDGDNSDRTTWTIPVGIAIGFEAPEYTLLSERDAVDIAAGRCDEPLRANAGDVGFYRVAYDNATLAANRAVFATLPDDDKIAMLDDQWALVGAGKARLDSYYSLVAAMGSNLNPRAWEQIAGALRTIDRDERGTKGQAAFEAYARSVLAPLAVKLGFDELRGDPPTTRELRHEVVGDLGAWDDPKALDWAQLQFARTQLNRDGVSADDQAAALGIVGEHADARTFDQLRALVRSARDETEFRRYSNALALVPDARLAAGVLALALSPEIPAQADAERLQLVYAVAELHPALSYRFLQANAARLFKANSVEDSVFVAQELPEIYWDAAPINEVVAWTKAHTPAEAAPELARGSERARYRVTVRARLDAQADALSTVSR